MSETFAFDTHRFIKNLTQNGFTEQQAEALAEEQGTLLNSNLATKQDVAALQKDSAALHKDVAVIQQDLEALRQETKKDFVLPRQETKTEFALVRQDLEALKSSLIKWLFGGLIAQGGLIVTIVVALV